MKKCKYIGTTNFEIHSVVRVFKPGDYFYYKTIYSYNRTNPWHEIYNLNHINITTFSRGEFNDMFVDVSEERKMKLKKLNESNL